MQCTLSPSGKLRQKNKNKKFCAAANLKCCRATFPLFAVLGLFRAEQLVMEVINVGGPRGRPCCSGGFDWLSFMWLSQTPHGVPRMHWCPEENWRVFTLLAVSLSLLFIVVQLYHLFVRYCCCLLFQSQHAELRRRVGHHGQCDGAADVLISSGSCGAACPSVTAGGP